MTKIPKEPTPQPDIPLRDEIADLLLNRTDMGSPVDDGELGPNTAADAIMQLLMERGHYMPGTPPAAQILKDAQSFAERLTLSNLALRIQNMLFGMSIETPETRPAVKWLDDYLQGVNHGPVGQPMLWPAGLPALADRLRAWGFEPTPTKPQWVTRSLPHPAMQ